MDTSVKITEIKTLHQIEDVWTNADFVKILENLEFSKPEQIPPAETQEYLFMALNELDPVRAAEILLTYKFDSILKKGQIQNIAEDMIDNKIAEDYSDISLHYRLYNINQLLFKAFNGVFPDTKASLIYFNIASVPETPLKNTKEFILKAISNGLKSSNIITRLCPQQLSGKTEFTEAEHIIWKLTDLGNKNLSLLTSDYWINEEDFDVYEFNAPVKEFVLINKED